MTGWRNALYGSGVLVGLLALVVVPAVFSAVLPREGPPLQGRVDIGYGASVVAPTGARLDLVDSRPGGGEIVLLVGDGLRVRLSAQFFQGDPLPVITHARHKIVRDEWLRPSGPPEPLVTESGLSGEWGSLLGEYAGEDSACYAVLTGGGVAVTALVTPAPNCAELPVPVRDALLSIQVEEP
ncbi:MAG TPA: hypothetical protein VFX61_20830 [Micromonosporaceae bacterium]|nr:hypothetical protein [Micromonosporaceae bacterium]